ncbi:capsule biosynthesis protein [Palleronia sp. KMU-117]|uniref:capsule biosynthesis protein n=1 Tax=Palleronia sp. KMU-117 TaxID=3434108 RepID=UPI003D742F84
MTTKPTARRFRIRRDEIEALRPGATPAAKNPMTPVTGAAPGGTQGATQGASQGASQGTGVGARPEAAPRGATPDDGASLLAPHDDGFGAAPYPGSAKAEAARAQAAAAQTAATQTAGTQPAAVGPQGAIAEIGREGLTGRQLRLARRMAQKHGFQPASDFDAVRLLRAAGIDPFRRESLLELVVPQSRSAPADGAPPEGGIHLPQTVPGEAPTPALPPAPPNPIVERAREVQEIQRDIVRRRRRRLAMLFARLSFFVLLPTLLAGYYYFAVATPLYSTKSSLRIDQSGGPASAGGLGGLFSGTGLATSQDAVGVQDYLASMQAMLRLEEDMGFEGYFSDPAIDPLLRLPADATNEEAYKLYKRLVSIGYDPTEGVIRLEVKAPAPEVSVAFSERLISYAEEQADSLTQKMRQDQMSGAFDALQEAEAKMIAAQGRVLDLQEQLGVLDPQSETAALMGQITTFETQLAEKRLQRDQLLDNSQPNQARVSGVEGDIARLEQLVADLRSQMTDTTGGARSLARISGELRMAEVDLETRTMMMQEALRQVETARIEANRQVTYLSRIVNPVLPEEASYPRAFENTLLAFLVLSGLYLMASITISILREQV